MDGFIEAVRQIVSESSQREVARAAGLAQSTISRMLSKQRVGQAATLYALLGAYPELARLFLSQIIPNPLVDSDLG